MKEVKQTLHIEGMHCRGCEMRVEQALLGLDGMNKAAARYAGSDVRIEYDAERLKPVQIAKALEDAGYPVVEKDAVSRDLSFKARMTRLAAAIGIGAVLYVLLSNFGVVTFLPTIDQNMTYGVLFVTGLLTSVHCIAMCGGINLTQNIKHKQAGETQSRFLPGLLYNLGRVISYTLIGGVVGALGSVITPSGAFRGFIAVLAGVFMVLMGLNLLEVFPGLNRLMGRLPRLLRVQNKPGAGPFAVGLVNGLMPCGPLQAMQLYALASGSILTGALSMLLFGLGTVPLMLLLSVVSALLSARFTRNMMRAGAVLVMALGLLMFNQGMSLSGVALPGTVLGSTVADTGAGKTEQPQAQGPAITDGVQRISSTFAAGRYAPITVQAGIPVEWTIEIAEKDINGCNYAFVIPAYDVQVELQPGKNVVNFTPTQAGTVPYSCWMGMIRSAIKVEEVPSTEAGGGSVPAAPVATPASDVSEETPFYLDNIEGSCCS